MGVGVGRDPFRKARIQAMNPDQKLGLWLDGISLSLSFWIGTGPTEAPLYHKIKKGQGCSLAMGLGLLAAPPLAQRG